MSWGVAHSFLHPQIQQGEKAAGGKRTAMAALCLVFSAPKGLMLSKIYRGKRVARLELPKVLYSTKVTCRCS